ncbi:glycosyltransferase family 2 protein [Aliisedimentitalea scapharcae]|uniref:Glycosyltransferase family 2 protein n=1 Tax=Aliisedimentitalea scapharcae TaxID=1524259 RepID=A0ABZ2XYY4_9RHOB
MKEPTIQIIILNFRTPDMTLRCMETALRDIRTVPGEVLVIDNDSGDGSYELIRDTAQEHGWFDDGRLRVIASDHNGGFGAGMNIGFATPLSNGADPDYFYLLNSDAFPQPGAMRLLRDFLMANTGAGMVGSYLQGVDGEPHCTAFRYPTIAGEFEGAARTGVFSRLLKNAVVPMGIPTQETRVDWTAGASLMIRREVIEEVGGFDETFFLYYEETDLCHRAARAGWSTHYLPASEVIHIGSASTGMKTWARTPQYWFDSRLHYFTKTHGRLYATFATLARISGTLIWKTRCLIQSKPQADPPGFLVDLITHSIRATARRHPTTRREPSHSTLVSEDPK